jgi:glycosyltransferase involved in cell wall biosynthesis
LLAAIGSGAVDAVTPSVSVVIPTRDRAGLLSAALDALSTQEGAPQFEVVVVDDASSDETATLVRRRATSTPFPLVLLRQQQCHGPAAARNRGWRATEGDVVCFTDDDCVPQPSWLATLTAGLGDADLAQGCTAPNPDQRWRWGPFSHTVEVKTEAGLYETCNMAYRRSILEATGGFDESFVFPYGEDAELAWRAKAAGARSVFVPEAVVHHEIGDSDFVGYLRSLRRRAALVRLVRLHPEVRSVFPRSWYHKSTHPAAVICLVATARALRRPRSARRWVCGGCALAVYARVCLRTWKAPNRARYWGIVVPLALSADLVEVAILAAASARERTLFL